MAEAPRQTTAAPAPLLDPRTGRPAIGVYCGDCGEFVRHAGRGGGGFSPGPCSACRRVVVEFPLPPLAPAIPVATDELC